MNKTQIKMLEGVTVTPEQWHEIRHSKDVKRVSNQGYDKNAGACKHLIVFHDSTYTFVYL